MSVCLIEKFTPEELDELQRFDQDIENMELEYEDYKYSYFIETTILFPKYIKPKKIAICGDHPYKRALKKKIYKAYYQKNRENRLAYYKIYYRSNKGNMSAYYKIYGQSNKEKIAAYQKDYRKENQDRLAAYSRAYYQKNKDMIKAYKRAYYKKNKSKGCSM